MSRRVEIPQGWTECPPRSSLIADRFVSSKTFLSDRHIPRDKRHTWKTLKDSIQSDFNKRAGMVVDLTNTDHYYDKNIVERENDLYVKISCKGHGECPKQEDVSKFKQAVNSYISKHPEGVICVQCTRGYNRAGFMIISYLCEEMKLDFKTSIWMFAGARSPGVYKKDYLAELARIFGAEEPRVPSLPWWHPCSREADPSIQSKKRRPSYDEMGSPDRKRARYLGRGYEEKGQARGEERYDQRYEMERQDYQHGHYWERDYRYEAPPRGVKRYDQRYEMPRQDYQHGHYWERDYRYEGPPSGGERYDQRYEMERQDYQHGHYWERDYRYEGPPREGERYDQRYEMERQDYQHGPYWQREHRDEGSARGERCDQSSERERPDYQHGQYQERGHKEEMAVSLEIACPISPVETEENVGKLVCGSEPSQDLRDAEASRVMPPKYPEQTFPPDSHLSFQGVRHFSPVECPPESQQSYQEVTGHSPSQMDSSFLRPSCLPEPNKIVITTKDKTPEIPAPQLCPPISQQTPKEKVPICSAELELLGPPKPKRISRCKDLTSTTSPELPLNPPLRKQISRARAAPKPKPKRIKRPTMRMVQPDSDDTDVSICMPSRQTRKEEANISEAVCASDLNPPEKRAITKPSQFPDPQDCLTISQQTLQEVVSRSSSETGSIFDEAECLLEPVHSVRTATGPDQPESSFDEPVCSLVPKRRAVAPRAKPSKCPAPQVCPPISQQTLQESVPRSSGQTGAMRLPEQRLDASRAKPLKVSAAPKESKDSTACYERPARYTEPRRHLKEAGPSDPKPPYFPAPQVCPTESQQCLQPDKQFMDGLIKNVDKVTDPSERCRIVTTVIKMCHLEGNCFPGTQPVGMNTNNIMKLCSGKYKVTWKPESQRYMMLILGANMIYMINKDLEVFKVKVLTFPNKQSLDEQLCSTLLDGEVVLDKYPECVRGRYLVFDIISFQGQDVYKMNFADRFKYIAKEIVEPRTVLFQRGKLDKRNEPFSVTTKEFCEVIKARSLLEGEFSKHLMHKNTGLIFQPADVAYKFGRSDDILEWRMPESNSAFFLLRIDENTFRKPVARLFVADSIAQFGCVSATEELMQFNGKIVEFFWDCQEKIWIFEKERSDKSNPMTYNEAMNIFMSADNPVTDICLYEAVERGISCRPLNNKRKREP